MKANELMSDVKNEYNWMCRQRLVSSRGREVAVEDKGFRLSS